MNIADDLGMNPDTLALLAIKVEVYAGKAAIEPLLRVTEHEVILRGTWIRVPCLCECRRSVAELVSITRAVGPHEHVIQNIRSATIRERADDIVKSDVAGGYMVLMSANVLNKFGENAGTMIFSNDIEGKRHGVGGLAPLVVVIGFSVKKVCVD